MKINTKTRYGLRAMIELSLVNPETGILQKDIAKNQDISEKYLDHIIAALKVYGLIKNVKGKKSGYRLTRDPEEITVKDIFKAFDPSLIDIACLSGDDCVRLDECAASIFWNDFESAIDGFLSKVSLKELSDVEMKMRESKNEMYYI